MTGLLRNDDDVLLRMDTPATGRSELPRLLPGGAAAPGTPAAKAGKGRALCDGCPATAPKRRDHCFPP